MKRYVSGLLKPLMVAALILFVGGISPAIVKNAEAG